MRSGDLGLVARIFDCWARSDLDGMIACVDPQLEWLAAVDGGEYRGHDGVREFFRRLRGAGERLEVPLQRMVELEPGIVLAVGRLRKLSPGRGFADSPGVWIINVSDGRITRIHAYRSERQAREAFEQQSAARVS